MWSRSSSHLNFLNMGIDRQCCTSRQRGLLAAGTDLSRSDVDSPQDCTLRLRGNKNLLLSVDMLSTSCDNKHAHSRRTIHGTSQQHKYSRHCNSWENMTVVSK